MSEIVGFNITPDSGTSLRKVLKYNLEAHMERFEAISAAASKVKCIKKTSLSLFLSLSLCFIYMYMYSPLFFTVPIHSSHLSSLLLLIGVQFRESYGQDGG